MCKVCSTIVHYAQNWLICHCSSNGAMELRSMITPLQDEVNCVHWKAYILYLTEQQSSGWYRIASLLLAVAISRWQNDSSSPQVSVLVPKFPKLISSPAAIEWLVHCFDFQPVSHSHMLTITFWQKRNTILRLHIGARQPCTAAQVTYCLGVQLKATNQSFRHCLTACEPWKSRS